MLPGHTTDARTPGAARASSWRTDSISPTTACFDDTYGASPGVATNPAPDATASTCPRPRRTIGGSAARTPCTTPQ